MPNCSRHQQMRSKRTTHYATAFTLIELLVVIATIGLLAALLLASVDQGKKSAQSAGCKSNLRQIGLALRLYVDEYNNYPLLVSSEIPASPPILARLPSPVLQQQRPSVFRLSCEWWHISRL